MRSATPGEPGGSGPGPSAARVAALDLGKARVGVAISDELGMLAHPRKALDGSSRNRLLDALDALRAAEGVTRWLVGLPVDMLGMEGTSARRARAFAEVLAARTKLPVELVDERLTTVEAARRLDESGTRKRDRQKVIDGQAACVLLDAWLRQHATGDDRDDGDSVDGDCGDCVDSGGGGGTDGGDGEIDDPNRRRPS